MDAEQKDEAETAWRLIHEFVPRINNQLAISIGTLDLLLTDEEIPPSLRRRLQTALASLEQVTTEIRQLHQTARPVRREDDSGRSHDILSGSDHVGS